MAGVFQRGGKGKYLASYVDGNGKRRNRSTGTTDKRTALQIQRAWEAEAAQRRAGLIDPAAERFRMEAAKPFQEHVEAYRLHLQTGAAGAKHVENVVDILRRFAESAGVRTLSDLDADGVNSFAAEAAAESSRMRPGRKLSTATVHSYITSIKAFAAWLTEGGKLPRNPLAGVQSPSSKREDRRRMLLREELPWLEAATRGGGVFRRMTGERRWLLRSCGLPGEGVVPRASRGG